MMTVTAKSLRDARVEAGWTLRDLARDLGISAAHLSDMERGNRTVKFGVVTRAAALLRLEVDWERVDCGHCNGAGQYGVPVIARRTPRRSK